MSDMGDMYRALREHKKQEKQGKRDVVKCSFNKDSKCNHSHGKYCSYIKSDNTCNDSPSRLEKEREVAN